MIYLEHTDAVLVELMEVKQCICFDQICIVLFIVFTVVGYRYQRRSQSKNIAYQTFMSL